MGLFDGTPSSADLAATFGVPVLAVIGAHGMAQTFGALAFGLARYRPEVPFHGVLANRVASARHAQMLSEAIPEGLRYCGHLSNADAIALPDRHLGLTQAAEIADLDARLERAADAIGETALRDLPPAVQFEEAGAGQAAASARRRAHRDRARCRVFVHLSGERRSAASDGRAHQHVLAARRRTRARP